MCKNCLYLNELGFDNLSSEMIDNSITCQECRKLVYNPCARMLEKDFRCVCLNCASLSKSSYIKYPTYNNKYPNIYPFNWDTRNHNIGNIGANYT